MKMVFILDFRSELGIKIPARGRISDKKDEY
jgi:hypothetical protein